jgi:nucleoside-diphosphate-sugar epimerase
LNVLITGGNGFLGSALAEKFYNQNFKVSLIVRPKSNLSRIQKHINNYFLYELLSENNLEEIIKKSNPDIIIHTACNYGRKNEYIIDIFDTNYRLGLLIFNEIIKLEKKIIFLNVGTILPAETNLYSFSKNQFSDLGKYITTNFENIIFKNILLQHMYGPGDDESKFTTYVINSCLNNVQEVNLTSGEQLRDFIYIKDVTDAISIICKKVTEIKSIDIEVGSGVLISIKEFVLKLYELTKSTSNLNFGAISVGNKQIDIPASNLSILNSFKWKPKYNLEDGLSETINMEVK